MVLPHCFSFCVLPLPDKERAMSAGKKRPRERDGESIQVITLEPSASPAAGSKKGGRTPAPEIGPITPDVSSFLQPMSRDVFFDQIYQQKALAVKVHPKLRTTRLEVVASLMEGFNPVAMLQQSNSEGGISVWMKCNVGGQSVLQSIKVGPSEAKTAYDAGHSLYFRGSELLESTFLPAFAKSVGYNFGANFRDGLRRSEIEVFASHTGHLTDWHFDFQENFTIQLRGSKKWSIYKASIPHPHRACAMHFHGAENVKVLHTQHQIHRLDNPNFCGLPENIEELCETVILQPGDVLYHPAGCWHKVETIVGPEATNSLSINMSFFPMTWGDLMTETLQQHFATKPHWRERIRFDCASEARAHLGSRMKNLVSEIGALTAKDVIPDVICEENRLRYVIVDNTGAVVESNSEAWRQEPSATNPQQRWRRNPLGILSKTEDFFAPPVSVPKRKSGEGEGDEEFEEIPDSDDEDEEEGDTEVDVPEGYLRFDYHCNFIAEESLPGPPAVHVSIFVDPKFSNPLMKAAMLSPTHAGPLAELPDDLAKVLQHVGYLSPH